jgi:dihydroflavonol-4-reductase
MILVTGATGHLGAHLLYELARTNQEVKALYRNPDKISNVKRIFGYYQADFMELYNRIQWVRADVGDYLTLTECLKGVDQVYHAAGHVSFDDKDWKLLHSVNIDGTANIVNACLESGVRKLCHVSSIATLGETNGQALTDESMIWNFGSKASAYAISKYKGEMEVWRGIYEGLDAVIINPSVIIGPGMWMGPSRQLLLSVYKGLKYYPSGSSGYVDVRDIARIMVLLMQSSCTGERYIINSENITHRRYMNLLADAMNRPRPKILISPALAKIGAIAEAVRSTITRRAPRITKRALEIADERLAYSNAKVSQATGVNFIPVEESVKFSTHLFLNEMKSV